MKRARGLQKGNVAGSTESPPFSGPGALHAVSFEGMRVLVVGGGLTAGHIAVRAANDGAVSVTLAARRKIRVRQFDLALEWMGTRRNHFLAKFWSIGQRADDQVLLAADAALAAAEGERREEPTKLTSMPSAAAASRAATLRDTKDGGSMSPEVRSRLDALANDASARASGSTRILEAVEVIGAEWVTEDSPGLVGQEGNSCSPKPGWKVSMDDGTVHLFDIIVLATGTSVDAKLHPLFRGLEKNSPAGYFDGLPVLTEELRWAPDLSAFVMGAYAGIQLGPGANNLMGARAGAHRIAAALRRENE